MPVTNSHPHTPTRAPRRAVVLAGAAAGLAAALAGCVDRTVGPRVAGQARLAVSFETAAIPNGTLDVEVFYRQDNATSGSQVRLFQRQLRSDELGGALPASFDSRCAASALAGQLTNCTVQVPVEVNLADCLADSRRRPEGPGCPIVVTLVLRDASGRTLGTASVGPVAVRPGQPVVLPEVTLPLRG